MKFLKITAAVATVLALGSGVAMASSHGNKYVMSAPLNGQTFIMYQNHFSLYFYAKDAPGVSNCYGECAVKWPPAILPADTPMPENYTLIPRKDGSMQIAFKGRPMYLYSGDKKIGDIKGVGLGGVWELAIPF